MGRAVRRQRPGQGHGALVCNPTVALCTFHAYLSLVPLTPNPTNPNPNPNLTPIRNPRSYIEACGYDGAGGVLKHMYGDSLTQPAGPAKPENLLVFDQSAFWINATHPELKSPNLPADGSGGTAAFAYAYVPASCRKQAGAVAGMRSRPPCRMHLYHHGCGGEWGSDFYNGVTHHGGFNEWAEANDLVIVYPAMRSWGVTGQARGGCWDGYAQTGSDYGLQSGAQISVVHNMIAQLAGL